MKRACLPPKHVLAAFLAMVLVLSCAEPIVPTAPTLASNQGRHLAQPTITVYGPVTFTRWTGKPHADSAAFSTQPGDTLTFTVTSDASQGLNASIVVNGVTIFATTDGNGLPAVIQTIALATNTVRVSLAGKPGSRITIAATIPSWPAVPALPDDLSFDDDSMFTVASPESDQTTYYRRQVELAFLDGTPDSLKSKLFRKYQASVVGGNVYAASYFLKLGDPGPAWEDYRNRLMSLRAEPGVRSVSAAERTAILKLNGYPSDGPGMRKQNWLAQPSDTTWALRAIRAPEAWSCENGTYSPTPVKVAVWEAAWPQSNRTFDNAGVHTVWLNSAGRTRLYSSGNAARLDSLAFHGLAVAGTLTAPGDDGYGSVGVSWRTGLTVYHTSNGFGLARAGGLFQIGTVIRSAAEEGNRVLSVSTGYGFGSSDTSVVDLMNTLHTLKEVFERHPQFLLVVANGNDDHELSSDFTPGRIERQGSDDLLTAVLMRLGRMFPALRSHFIIVASSTPQGARSKLSYFFTGGGTDLFAPGERVAVGGLPTAITADFRPELVLANGTSFAAPLVAGAAALLWAMDPTLSAADVRQYLLDGARAYRTLPSSADSVASQPIYQGVHLLDVYGALRLLSNSKPGTPLCGVETRIVPGELATVGVFRGSGGGTETALLLGPYGTGYSAPLPALSIAQGGRKFVVNNFGDDIAEVSLSNGAWSAPRRLGLGAGWQRAFLEKDTLDLRYRVYMPPGPPPIGPLPAPDSTVFEYRLVRGDGTVFRGQLDSLLAVGGSSHSDVLQAAASPDGTWLAVNSWYSKPGAFWGERLQLVPLTGALGSVVLKSFSSVENGADVPPTTVGDPFFYGRVTFRPDSWSFWAALGNDLSLEEPMVRYDRTNNVGGWTPVAERSVETGMLEWTWLADPNVLLAVNQFGTECRVTRRASSEPQNYKIVGKYCPYALPAMMLRQHPAAPLR